MRIKSIQAKDTIPVRSFEVTDLANMVFLAGPNGIGKSRLIEALLNYLRHPHVNPSIRMEVEASSESEVRIWGKEVLDLSNQEDCEKLRQTLQQNQRRRNFHSSILYYESNRQITNLKPLTFTWEYTDPYEEQVNWDYSFQPLRGRVQDTIHSIFKKIQSQKSAIANRAIQLKEEGKESMRLSFSDPLDPFREAFEQLLSPKKLLGVDMQGNSLRILDGEQELTEKALSSGEREVLNIVFDFILRQPSDCVVFFDEPELHLHPELANKLIATLKTIGDGNQFIFCTHSAELLSGSLDNSVIFIQPQNEEGANQAVPVGLENGTFDALRAIGQSIGVVSLGKRIVLIEGTKSSLDKKTYLQIIKGRFPNLVLVPCEGKHTIQSFGHVADSVLSKTIWGVDFFLLADRDAFPDELAPKIEERGLGEKVKCLGRYHLENYFLDEKILSKVFEEMEDDDSWLRDPVKISKELCEIARSRIGYAVSLTVAKYLRDSVGNVDLMVGGCQTMEKGQLAESTVQRASIELLRVQGTLAEDAVRAKTNEYYERFHRSITDGTWKTNVPGKQILSVFATKAKLDQDRLKTLYIKKAMELDDKDNPFFEILSIFGGFST
jgi:energy-coupling factor transporter ATP-binding protein EcfA2